MLYWCSGDMDVHKSTLRCMTVGTFMALVVVAVVAEGRTKERVAGAPRVTESARDGWEL